MLIKMRQEVERKIATAIIEAGLSAGYQIAVNNGEEISAPLATLEGVLGAMFATDEEHLLFIRNCHQCGWVFLVYGNDGWDVVGDYSVNLEPLMVEANKISDHYNA